MSTLHFMILLPWAQLIRNDLSVSRLFSIIHPTHSHSCVQDSGITSSCQTSLLMCCAPPKSGPTSQHPQIYRWPRLWAIQSPGYFLITWYHFKCYKFTFPLQQKWIFLLLFVQILVILQRMVQVLLPPRDHCKLFFPLLRVPILLMFILKFEFFFF